MRVCLCVYVYIYIYREMRLDDALFFYFSFLWYHLPSVISHVTAYEVFYTSHFYLQDHDIFIRRVSFQTPLCSHLQCLHFISAPTPTSMHWQQKHSAQHLNAYVTQCDHQTDAVVPVTHYIQSSPQNAHFHFSPSITTRLESFCHENQQLCSISVMASWFFGTASSFVGKPRIQQHPLSFRNLKGDRHIWGFSLKSLKKACNSIFQPLKCSSYSITDTDRILYFQKVHMPCAKHGMSNCSSEIVS